MEENKKKEKNNKETLGIILIVISIILLGVGFGLYIVMPKNSPKSNKKSENNTESKEINDNTKNVDNNTESNNDNIENNIENNTENNNDNTIVELIDQNEANDIMNRFYKIAIEIDNFYMNDTYVIEKINSKELLGTIFRNMKIKNVCADQDSSKISFDEMNNTLKEYIVNKEVDINDFNTLNKSDEVLNSTPTSRELSISKPNGGNLYYIVDIVDNNTLAVTDNVCDASFSPDPFIKLNFVKGEKVGDIVNLYYKEAFVTYLPSDTGFAFEVFSDYNHTVSKEKLESNNYTPDSYNWDLYNTYKYSFKLIEGKYYFQSHELVNE